MGADLSARAVDVRELMDDPAADAQMLAHLPALRRGERRGVRPGALYRRDIRPRARTGRVRILDVGAGGGDLCRALASRLSEIGSPSRSRRWMPMRGPRLGSRA
jgi:hypothetical protein